MPLFDLDQAELPVRAPIGAIDLVDPKVLEDKQTADALKNEKAFGVLGAAFRESLRTVLRLS